MTISMRARAMRRAVGLFIAPDDASLERRRKDMERAGQIPKPRSCTYGQVTVGGVPGQRATPKAVTGRRHILYLHGGGYLMGSSTSHLGIAARLAAMAGATATVIDYRLAPEHAFPAAIDDCVAAAREIMAEVGAENVAIAGDSAGGGATMATLCALRDNGDALPACAFVLSPWTDLTLSGETISTKVDDDPMINDALLDMCVDGYLGNTAPETPLASPHFADLSGLPPLLIQVGSDEVLLSDATRLADNAKQHHVDVTLDIWHGMWHVFQGFVGLMPEATTAMQQGADFIARHTAGN